MNMANFVFCRLCLNICDAYKHLYDENGQTDVNLYELASKYFHQAFLTAAQDAHRTVICQECWRHISEFHGFQEAVILAQTKLLDGIPQVPAAIQSDVVSSMEVLSDDIPNNVSCSEEFSSTDNKNSLSIANSDLEMQLRDGEIPTLDLDSENEINAIHSKESSSTDYKTGGSILESNLEMQLNDEEEIPTLDLESEKSSILRADLKIQLKGDEIPTMDLDSENEFNVSYSKESSSTDNRNSPSILNSVLEMQSKENEEIPILVLDSENELNVTYTKESSPKDNKNSLNILKSDLEIQRKDNEAIPTLDLDSENEFKESIQSCATNKTQENFIEIMSSENSSEEYDSSDYENDLNFEENQELEEFIADNYAEQNENRPRLNINVTNTEPSLEVPTSLSERTKSINPKKHVSRSNKNDKTIAQWRKTLDCSHCHGTFPNYSLLREHFKECHPKERCHIVCCNRKIYLRFRIAEHARIHMNPDFYKCAACDICFKSKRAFKRHGRKHDPSATKNINTFRKRNLKQLDEFIALWKPNLECGICLQPFSNFTLLSRHFQQQHPNDYNPYIMCCNRAWYTRLGIFDHASFHRNPEAFKCHLCEKIHLSSSKLNIHKRKFHAETTAPAADIEKKYQPKYRHFNEFFATSFWSTRKMSKEGP